MKNLGLRWKIMVILAVVVPVLVGITVYMTSSFSSVMRKNAEEQGLEMAYRYANKIDASMSSAMYAARTMGRMIEGMLGREDGISREALRDSMKVYLRDHPNLLGVYAALEPNVLDGKDAEYANAPEHNADGRFVPWVHYANGQITVVPCAGYVKDDAGGTWYYGPKRSRQETVVEPYKYDVAGKQVLMVDMVAPLFVKGQFMGVLGVDYPMDTIDAFVRDIKVFNSGYGFLVTKTGTYVAHPDTSYVEKAVNIFKEPETTPEIRAGLQRVLKGESFVHHTVENGEPFIYSYVPVFIGRYPNPYIFALKIPMNEVLAETVTMRNTSFAVAFFAVILLFLLILFIARIITRPIQQTMGAVEAIANGDLSVTLDADSKDEVGRMQVAVNNMAEKLTRNMDEITMQKSAAEEKTRLAEQATREAEEAKNQAENAKREGMLMAAERLEKIVAHLSSASEEISAQSNEIRNGTDVQRERIVSTATAMEEMNATVLEVAQNAGETAKQASTSREQALEGANVVNESVGAMSAIQGEATELKTNMNQLGQQAEAIGAIMTVIEDIADQTNLLALNAAIEAARAGEAGRGFAVVADEVRKLAEKTMGATKEVGDSIRSIQQVAKSNIDAMDGTVEKIAAATDLSARSGEMLQAIVSGVEASADRVQSIATAAEQQSATSEEINQSIEEINQIALDTSQAVSEAAAAAEELAEQAHQLNGIIQDMKIQE